MKKIIVSLLIYSSGYCQDIEYIKRLDTIYILYKKSRNQTRQEAQDYRFYTFKLEKKSEEGFLYFTKPNYNDYSIKDRSSFISRIEKKSFLKKHKKDIIGINFFNKYGIEKSTFEAFEKCKVIYIIDCSESKKGKITLYGVLKSSSYVWGE